MTKTTNTSHQPETRAVPPQVYFRPIHDDDLTQVLCVQRQCYPPAMQEGPAVVRARIASSGRTSWVAVVDDEVHGYLFAYPSVLGKAAALNAPFALATQPDTLYLHDLAISPALVGSGVAKRLVRLADHVACAMELAYAALIAVQGSRPFWEKRGFRQYEQADAALEHVLSGYPPDSCYMFKQYHRHR